MTKIKKSLIAFLAFTVLFSAIFGVMFAFNANAEETHKKSDVFTLSDEIEKVENNYPFSSYAAEGLVEKSTNGVAIKSSISGATFTYKYPLRMDKLSKDTSLIELYALYGSEYSNVTAINITLTDTENALNSFSWRYYKNDNGATYCLINYSGRNIAWSTEGTSAGVYVWENKYGAYTPNMCFGQPSSTENYERPFSAFMDYAEMMLYCSYGSTNRPILDLDDVNCVGKGGVWGGFKNDTAYLSVSFELDAAKIGGVIVKSVLGYNLDGGFDNEDSYDAPTVTFEIPDEYLEVMPNGAVGVGYPLPSVYANDWFFGECSSEDVSISVFDSENNDVSNLIVNGEFKAEKTGEYTIRYTAKNAMKSSVKDLKFNVVDDLNPIVIVQTSSFGEPVILTQVALPSVEVYGGTGTVTVEESLEYNGQEVAINNSRTVYLDKSGTISLKVSAKGYSGEPTVRYFTLVIPESTVLSVSSMPMILQSDTSVVFPEAKAYDSLTKTSVSYTISVNGVQLNSNRTYFVPSIEDIETGQLTVVYKASTDAYGETEKTFVIPVVDAMFTPKDIMVAKSGSVAVQDSSSALILTTEQSNSEVNWAYPIVTGSASVNPKINISGIVEENSVKSTDYDYIDVTFANYENTSETMFVRIYKDCDAGSNMSYVQINGAGEKYLVDGNLKIPNSVVTFYLNTAKGYLYDSVKFTPICAVSDYTANVSIVGFRFGKVYGDAGISISQISNQSLGSSSSWYDNTAPVISFNKEMLTNMNANRGKTFEIPATFAYDMLSYGSTVSVSVKSPDGTVILTADDLSNGVNFVTEQTGKYQLTFTAKDTSGNQLRARYFVHSYDDVSPVITVKKSVKSTITVGSSVTIPKATVKDNIDESCSLTVFVRNLNDYNVEEVTMNKKYKFTAVGTYEITYLACDSDYNFTELVITVKVVA